MAILVLYVLINICYSLIAKKIPYLDILILAGLYVLRVIAGGFATDITTSKWLFLFVLFFFLSLAIVKRIIELMRIEHGQTKFMEEATQNTTRPSSKYSA
jgi:4-hydroxybenzoate polyprenyltransferase